MVGHGEAAIKAWYLSNNAIATVSVGYEKPVAREAFAEAPRQNFIDELVLAKLENLNVPAFAAGRRRRVPPPGVRRHDRPAAHGRGDQAVSRRPLGRQARTTDRRAARAARVRRLLGLQVVRPAAGQQREAAAARPCGRITTGFATTWPPTRPGTSSPASSSPPPAARWKTARPISSCCTRIRPSWPKPCRWRFWACRSTARSATTIRSRSGPTTSITAWPTCSPACDSKEAAGRRQPHRLRRHQRRTGPAADRQAAAAAPAGRRSALPTSTTRPTAAWRWPTGSRHAENPYFSRAITNRVWANFFGVGLVESVDDLRLTNPPSNAELLDAAGRLPGRAPLRLEGPDAGDPAVRHLSAIQPAAARRTRTTTRFYSRYYPAADDGRSAARRPVASHRRADAVRRLCPGLRGPCSCPTRT